MRKLVLLYNILRFMFGIYSILYLASHLIVYYTYSIPVPVFPIIIFVIGTATLIRLYRSFK